MLWLCCKGDHPPVSSSRIMIFLGRLTCSFKWINFCCCVSAWEYYEPHCDSLLRYNGWSQHKTPEYKIKKRVIVYHEFKIKVMAYFVEEYLHKLVKFCKLAKTWILGTKKLKNGMLEIGLYRMLWAIHFTEIN